MPRLSDSFRSGLDTLATEYQKAMSDEVRSYLHGRGIDDGAIEQYRLGEVTKESEHGWYAGMICFPYITKHGVCSLKFRAPHDCTSSCEHQKYVTPYPTRLYNTLSMDRADEIGLIATTEGEINAITLEYHGGIPAVGIPGADTWKKHPEWRLLFQGYKSVLVFQDPDKDGLALGKQIRDDVRDAHTLTLSTGKDANAAYTNGGLSEIKTKAGLDA